MADPDTPEVPNVDLDALFADRFAGRKSGEVKATVTMFGRTWRLVDRNILATVKVMNVTDDPSNIIALIQASFHDEDGAEFIQALEDIPDLTGEELGEVYAKIVEAAAGGRPTKRSSNSRTTSSTRRRTTS